MSYTDEELREIIKGKDIIFDANNRKEAYDNFIEFEMGFLDPECRHIVSFEEFCKELDKGYGQSLMIQIGRLIEINGKIYYDNDYVN